jgi:uncharacterized coiled-coil protein SlyX
LRRGAGGGKSLRMPLADDDERFIELETKIAYQEKTILELNEVVVELNQLTSDLARRLHTLERCVQSELGPREMPNEAPPHY